MVIKIALIDIESSPNLVYCWKLFKQTIPINHIVDSASVLCWSAKWLGEKAVYFDSIYKSSHKKMLQGIHKILNEADAIISYNGRNFDSPTLNKEFLLAGMSPPSPYKHIDLLETARKQFNFVSNKLDYVAQALGFEGKTKHEGFKLWVDCLAKDPKAWKTMETYNKNDVVILEQVYNRFLPWVKGHPNANVFSSGVSVCPKCAGTSYQSRGTYKLTTGVFRKLQCNSCHGWFKGEKIEKLKVEFKEIS